MTHLGMEMTGV